MCFAASTRSRDPQGGDRGDPSVRLRALADRADDGLSGGWASPSRDPLNPFPHIGFTVAFNMSEQPAASVPCGFDDERLPIGLQIVGRRFDDVGVLAVARSYEAIRSAKMRPWPEPPDTPPPTQPLFVV